MKSTPAVNAKSRGGGRILAAGLVALFAMPMFAGTSSADDFSNATPITLPLADAPGSCPPVCPPDKATPYPSEIAVSGLTGTVTDINVILRDLTWVENGPPDADIMVVAPDGKAVMFMSDACGTNAAPNPFTTPITLTFDDQAASPLPADSACSAGTFRPVDDDDDGDFDFGPFPDREPDIFPDAPAAPVSAVPLSTFNGIDPNGNWQLYVMDDWPNSPAAGQNSGRIAGGWTLQVATTTTAATTSTTMGSGTQTTTTTIGDNDTAASTTTTRPAVAATTGTTTTTVAVRATTVATLPKTGPSTDTSKSVGLGALLVSAGLLLTVLAQRRRMAR